MWGCGVVQVFGTWASIHVSTTATAIWWDNMENHKLFFRVHHLHNFGAQLCVYFHYTGIQRYSKKVLGICRYVSQHLDWFRLWLIAATCHHVHVVPKTAEKYHWYPSKQHVPNIHPTKRDLKPSHPIKLGTPSTDHQFAISSGRLADWIPKQCRGCHGNFWSASEFPFWVWTPSKHIGHVVFKHLSPYVLFRQYPALNCLLNLTYKIDVYYAKYRILWFVGLHAHFDP